MQNTINYNHLWGVLDTFWILPRYKLPKLYYTVVGPRERVNLASDPLEIVNRKNESSGEVAWPQYIVETLRPFYHHTLWGVSST